MMAVLLSPIASTARQAPAKARRRPPAAAVTAGGGIASGRQVLLRPGLRIVERRGEAADHLLDLVGFDDQRRAEADRIADIADYEAMMVAALEEVGAEPADRVELPLGPLVGDQLDRGDQPDAAHLADQGMVGMVAQALEQEGRHLRGMLDQLLLLDDPQVLEADGGRHRVGAGGEAMAEVADLGGVVG